MSLLYTEICFIWFQIPSANSVTCIGRISTRNEDRLSIKLKGTKRCNYITMFQCLLSFFASKIINLYGSINKGNCGINFINKTNINNVLVWRLENVIWLPIGKTLSIIYIVISWILLILYMLSSRLNGSYCIN